MSVSDYLYQLREMPEIEHQEFRTSSFIAGHLKNFGYQVIEHVGGTTGVIGIYDSGKEGKTVGIRADMDALPFEENGVTVMKHACGHDANCAVGLEAARRIIECGIDSGKFYALFHPAEEGTNGALSVIQSGLIDDMDELIAVHLLNTTEESGRLGAICPAQYHCGAAQVHGVYHGKSAHGSKPWEAINALEAALAASYGLSLLHSPSDDRWSVTTTKINTGSGGINTIPDTAEIGIDVRCDNNREMEHILSKIENILQKAGEMTGASLDLEPLWFNAADELDEDLIRTVKEAVVEYLGGEYLIEPVHSSGAEDFVEYHRVLGIKSAYMAVNAHVKNGLHHPMMHYEAGGLDGAAEVLKTFVIKRTSLSL